MRLQILSFMLISILGLQAQALPSPDIVQRIVSQGVPEDALTRLLDFIYFYNGRSFYQEIYVCAGAPLGSAKPCEESKRIPSFKFVTLRSPTNVVIINYGAPSTDYRFFLINLETGDVTRFYSSHGVGSGKSNFASRFSNIQDSRQTSLGIFMTGETYVGRYGQTLRMYGLQTSNDQAYKRDIVLHGAWYVGDKFINSIDPTTGLKYGRLGLSWGCPAVSTQYIQSLITTLGSGSLIMHYHNNLMESALTGGEVIATGTDVIAQE
ncbi:murein L,D-transpeptidase catalytic domain family protein [Bdellovibrio sp. HCB2-146]|uniref:murein L,D-transpeptidase catalytic domain family protein n=1 Tax=Bdellovibrio sp. HCB2-146 TaxID=3394362 RepID=UPI0039BC72DF